MDGTTKIHLALFYAFFCQLATCTARVETGMPIVHTVPLQNRTSIPEEYENFPVVGKCCGANEILVKNQTQHAVCTSLHAANAGQFSPLFTDFNKTGVIVPGEEKNEFLAITGNPCQHERYMLSPEEYSDDEYYVLLNGSIFVPHYDPILLSPGVDYCMDVIPKLGQRIFVCFAEEHVVTASTRITIYTCGLLISVPFFLLTIVAYSITPKLDDVYGKALCRYCGCLALAFTALAITQIGSVNMSDQTCICIAFVIQFSFVACFFWLNVMCIETWSLVRSHVERDRYRRMRPKTRFFCYSLWGWGPAAILILLSMVMDLSPMIPSSYVKPNFGQESCWFRSDEEAMPYFYVPIGLLLIGNLTLFVLTGLKLSKYQQDLALRRLARNEESDRLDQRHHRRLKRTFFVCVFLFFLMGLNWSMELISWWVGGNPLAWSAFDLVNALQGVLVFGLFVLRRPPRDFVWHRIQKLRGIDVAEPQIGSMDLMLLPAMNGDVAPRQTIIP